MCVAQNNEIAVREKCPCCDRTVCFCGRSFTPKYMGSVIVRLSVEIAGLLIPVPDPMHLQYVDHWATFRRINHRSIGPPGLTGYQGTLEAYNYSHSEKVHRPIAIDDKSSCRQGLHQFLTVTCNFSSIELLCAQQHRPARQALPFFPASRGYAVDNRHPVSRVR